ncbi:hypothetical protein Mal64_23930 [Pseudobythopirellula maris]|uniref:Dockerin domain-containing protein n=1 Tax=Pseudobythopirellula maris TaxID=2527991 RepID=A0A5C5ZRQ4_9BACT|nr:dockerin type I domain-containing protein [Pseudobythopirellula maris]TWT88903.1 hypothetical protein Mal64_23930 [Pseudobythopirellula maris]
MRNTLLLLATSASLLSAGAMEALGHGRELRVTRQDNRLVVSHPPGDHPFSPLVFGQDDFNGEPEAIGALPVIGPAVLWGVPGLSITGLDNASSFSVEAIGHADPFAEPPVGDAPERYVWRWDAESEAVTLSDNGFSFVGVAGGTLTTQSFGAVSSSAPGPFEIADSLVGQQGYHNHDLVRFALEGGAAAPTGVYGVFMRFDTDFDAASAPVLVTFNHGVAYDLVAPASEAIYAAARPGDYNRDGVVDPLDHTLWIEQFGDSVAQAGLGADGNRDGRVDGADFTVWRDHFAPATPGVTAPEPGAALTMAAPLAAWALRRRNRTLSWGQKKTRPGLSPGRVDSLALQDAGDQHSSSSPSASMSSTTSPQRAKLMSSSPSK